MPVTVAPWSRHLRAYILSIPNYIIILQSSMSKEKSITTCETGPFSVFVTERKPLPFTDPQGTAEARLSLMKLMQLEL